MRCPLPAVQALGVRSPFSSPLQPNTEADLSSVGPGVGGRADWGRGAQTGHRTPLPDFLEGPPVP